MGASRFQMDRRSRKRFDLGAPVKYSWTDDEHVQRTGQGTTRDVSECGLFVLADSCPPLGSIVELDASFAFRDDSRVQLKATGQIVRVDSNGKALGGFAACTKALGLQTAANDLAGGTNVESAD